MARLVVNLGDDYDWGGSVRIFSADTLARRLSEQWKRNGRGELLLAEERERCIEREKRSRQEERLAIQRFLADISTSVELAIKHRPGFVDVLGDQRAYWSEKSLSEAQLATIRLVQGANPSTSQSATKALSSRDAERLRKSIEGLRGEDE